MRDIASAVIGIGVWALVAYVAASIWLLRATPGQLALGLRTLADPPGTLSPIRFFTGGLAVAGQPLTTRRLGVFLLDVLFALPVVGALRMALRLLVPAPPPEVMDVTIGLLAYFLVATVALGTTPGQRLLRLRVTRGPRYQAPHDMMTRTLVLRRATPTGIG